MNNQLVVEALEAAKDALKTWVATFAPDMCGLESVQEAKAKLNEFGTLWYIATANKKIHDAIAALRHIAEACWQPIETAPKDGTAIWLLSAGYESEDVKHLPRAAVGYWNPEGDSWVDEFGRLGGDCFELAVTGVWFSGMGWFQPNEVTHWMPLPSPPATKEQQQ